MNTQYLLVFRSLSPACVQFFPGESNIDVFEGIVTILKVQTDATLITY